MHLSTRLEQQKTYCHRLSRKKPPGANTRPPSPDNILKISRRVIASHKKSMDNAKIAPTFLFFAFGSVAGSFCFGLSLFFGPPPRYALMSPEKGFFAIGAPKMGNDFFSFACQIEIVNNFTETFGKNYIFLKKAQT